MHQPGQQRENWCSCVEWRVSLPYRIFPWVAFPGQGLCLWVTQSWSRHALVCFTSHRNWNKTNRNFRGYCQFDLYHDLGMRLSGDERKWAFKLNTQGDVTISFIGDTFSYLSWSFLAESDLNFPIMEMRNLDGMHSTISLHYKPKPEMGLTVYQCIKLSGTKRVFAFWKQNWIF